MVLFNGISINRVIVSIGVPFRQNYDYIVSIVLPAAKTGVSLPSFQAGGSQMT